MASSNLTKAIDMMEELFDPALEPSFTKLGAEDKLNVLAPLVLEMAKALESMVQGKGE